VSKNANKTVSISVQNPETAVRGLVNGSITHQNSRYQKKVTLLSQQTLRSIVLCDTTM